MQSTEVEALRLVAQSVILAEQEAQRASEKAMKAVLFDMSNLSQSHVWDSIDFYSRPAQIEACEREAHEIMDTKLWIELEDAVDYIDAGMIEDYYSGGFWV